MSNVCGTDEQKLRLLRETGHYLSVPKGISMWPMLKSRENIVDLVPVQGLLKPLDLVLYYREADNRYVLHRILQVKENHYVIYGDNCWQKELVGHEQVVGVAERFFRKGRWVSVKNPFYLAYVHLWCDFLPVRRCLFRLRDRIKAKTRKS